MSLENGLVSGSIVSLSVIVLFYWTIKTHRIEDIIVNAMEKLVQEVSQDAELQKNVYAIGALLGNGAKSGVGLSPRAGKFKFEDILMGALGQFLNKGQQEPSNSQGSQLP